MDFTNEELRLIYRALWSRSAHFLLKALEEDGDHRETSNHQLSEKFRAIYVRIADENPELFAEVTK